MNLRSVNYIDVHKINHLQKYHKCYLFDFLFLFLFLFFFFIKCMQSMTMTLSRRCFFFNFFIKCMQSMTMTLSRRCMYATLHVIWSKSLLYIFSLINHINSLYIQALLLKLLQLYFRFSLFLCTLRVLLFRF